MVLVVRSLRRAPRTAPGSSGSRRGSRDRRTTDHRPKVRLVGRLPCRCRLEASDLLRPRSALDPVRTKGTAMLIPVLLGIGMAFGWAAQVITGTSRDKVDWTLALVAGVLGSFVGGMIASLLFGDGLQVRPSGITGSLIGSIIVVLVWQRVIAPRRARS